jgi:transglutaminase-like putative cysteine protease
MKPKAFSYGGSVTEGGIFMFNFSRLTKFFISSIILLSLCSIANAQDITPSSTLDDVTISANVITAQGEFTLSISNPLEKTIKILVRKADYVDKWISVSNEKTLEQNIPLQAGDGTYEIYGMIHQNGNVYSYGPYFSIESRTQAQAEAIEVTGSEDMASLSAKLTTGLTSDQDKTLAIYTWMVNNLSYDYVKYEHMKAGDYSDEFGAEVILRTKVGVCYDYVKLFEGLMKAANIQVKSEQGYTPSVKGLHAWNQVFNADKNEWEIIDITSDSTRHYDKGNLNIRDAALYYATDSI